jgi:hypothetical protein
VIVGVVSFVRSSDVVPVVNVLAGLAVGMVSDAVERSTFVAAVIVVSTVTASDVEVLLVFPAASSETAVSV